VDTDAENEGAHHAKAPVGCSGVLSRIVVVHCLMHDDSLLARHLCTAGLNNRLKLLMTRYAVRYTIQYDAGGHIVVTVSDA
jgi:hypothetical protein